MQKLHTKVLFFLVKQLTLCSLFPHPVRTIPSTRTVFSRSIASIGHHLQKNSFMKVLGHSHICYTDRRSSSASIHRTCVYKLRSGRGEITIHKNFVYLRDGSTYARPRKLRTRWWASEKRVGEHTMEMMMDVLMRGGSNLRKILCFLV